MQPVRELDIEALTLKVGSHEDQSAMCVMEAVAFVAGEPWSDSPKCASGVIGAFLRRWNDNLNDADRQMLKPYVRYGITTASVGMLWSGATWAHLQRGAM